MPETKSSKSNPRFSLDVYAVTLALLLALLVRFNLIPAIKW
jgi:hypothetical protein